MMPSSRSGRGTIAYLAVASVQRGATFLALPLFAASLSPQQYGQIAILITVYGFVTLLLPVGLDAPLFRAVFSIESAEERRAVLTSLNTALFVGSAVGGTVIGLVLGRLPSIFGVEPVHLGLYVATAGIALAATSGPLALLRAEERFGAYAALSLSYAGVQVALRVILVVLNNRGVWGWVLADFAAALFVLMLSLKWQRHLLSPSRIRGKDLRAGLRMGAPLIPHFASHWLLNLSDRLILAAYSSAAVVGVYSMGYQIGFFAGMAVTELSRAFMPRYGEALQSSEARTLLTEHAVKQVMITIALTAGAALVGPQVVHHVLPDAYLGAAYLIPWVALGFTFLGFYYIPVNLLAIVAGDTQRLWRPTLCAALVNISANLILVPHFGPIAAAVNTAVGYLTLLILMSVVAYKRCPPVRLSLMPIAGYVATTMSIAAVGSIFAVRPGVTGELATVIAGALIIAVLAYGFAHRSAEVGAAALLFGDAHG